MADMLTIDPFFVLTGQINDVKTKVADGVLENYKMQVAQTNDINNRAMQTMISESTILSDIKAQIAAASMATQLSAARTDAAIAVSNATMQRVILEQADSVKGLMNGLNTQNLNTALVNTNQALVGLNGVYGGLNLAYGGAIAAVQSANTNSAINALGSAIAGQGMVNTGTMTGTTQTASPTTIR
jgi:hypothetical protein